MKRPFALAIASAALAVPASALADFNGMLVQPRVFNDFPTSTLVINNSNSIPGNVSIDDRDFSGSGFANRHDVLLSSDGGTTARTLSITEPFEITTDVTLTVGSNAPRKEAGLRVNSNVTGDALFIINSDAGEIVAFGGGAPFFLFGNNGGSNGYTPGTTITMGMRYTPGSPNGTVEYLLDRDGPGPLPMQSSGPLAWSNLEGGPVNFSVAMYGQFSPNLQASPADFATLTFNNVNAVIPEPASMAGLLLGGLLVARTRRR